MEDIYENTNDYNPNRKRKILIIFDDKITDIKSNKEIEARIENCLLGAEN